jgi:hypothetical protein
MLVFMTGVVSAQSLLNNQTIDGYRGIWFSLGKSEYGYKYSGGLGTYTVKHDPLAIYAPEVNKTFFVYGGTPSIEERRLLCMVGCFDHKTGMISRPVVVFDKEKVNDPHDDPTILIDSQGYIWVYVAGRANSRPGHRYRSLKPYDISEFELINSSVMAYPQPIYVEGQGHFLFFTRYDGVRQLFFQTSPDGRNWSDHRQIASIIGEGEKHSGHYSTTGHQGNKIAIAFNRHPDGKVDYRTNMYYLQTTDFGKTWTTVDGKRIDLPVKDRLNPSLVLEVESEGKNLYVKDINFDTQDNPVILYLTSEGWESGPVNGARQWYVCHWTGKKWKHSPITTSTHNYDSGSIWVEGNTWMVIAPTDPGPQKWGTGGEVVSWESNNRGATWKRKYTYTKDSPRNHGYVRRPVKAKDPFYCMWADGHSDIFSISQLYFGDSQGNIYMMPYQMRNDWEKPVKIGTADKIICNTADEIASIAKEMQSMDMDKKRISIGKYEITQKQWYAVMGDNPSHFQGETLPVMNVSWKDVQVFVGKLNKMTGKSYRLPTNDEWIFAAKGGIATKEARSFSGSKDIARVTWYTKNSGGSPHPVGSLEPNELGIYDMSGNVWEWVSTPNTPDAKAYHICGGAWNSEAGNCTVTYFNRHSSVFSSYDIGFRLVLDEN